MDAYELKIIFSYIILVTIVFLPTILLNMNKKNKMIKLLKSLKIGDKIVTIGGIHGSIVKILDNMVDIRIDKGVFMTISKNAIERVIND